MPRLKAPATFKGFLGRNGGPPLWRVASGMARHGGFQRGTAKRVHVQKDHTRRVHVVHAPVPGTS
ncbi:MAG TPA: hypothetical protein VKM55_09940 [Candidatus Lokiarchaeia archaeon]|nr:hypothetical protein [Candidatus Lokiarchaeia archaeon]